MGIFDFVFKKKKLLNKENLIRYIEIIIKDFQERGKFI